MSITTNDRIRPAVLQADREAHVALAAMTGYDPFNADYSLTSIAALQTAMQAAQEAEILADTALGAARDAAAAAEWRYHEALLGAKDQVIAQFGPSSDQVQALGLKKKSERKRPTRTVITPPEPEEEVTP